MQSTHITHKLIAGPQVEVISIAQYQGGMDLLEMFRGKGLDSCLRTDRGKNRCEQLTVGSGKHSRAGSMVPGCDLELEHNEDYTILELCTRSGVSMIQNRVFLKYRHRDVAPAASLLISCIGLRA
jgi:hypothetical protein